MADAFATYADSISAQANSWAAVTPSDSTDLTNVPKALYIGGAGNIVITGKDSVDATFAVTAGQVLPCRARRVKSTDTTATGIIALY